MQATNHKTLSILNLIVIIGLIIWNYFANAAGINGNTVGSLSDEYSNLFTPAGYAFSIWGLIFLSLLALGIFMVRRAFGRADKDTRFIGRIGPWLIVANLANGAWIWFWLNEQTLISVGIMLVLLLSLIAVISRLKMEVWDAPLPIIAFVWWPISLYSGWIAVATVANISAYLAKIGWQEIFSEVVWAAVMIIVATLINLAMIIYRNMREFAMVGVWALVAIAVRHWNSEAVLQYTALICAIVIFIAVNIHAYRNRHSLPFRKGYV